MRKATTSTSSSENRGVIVAPWVGPNGEIVLLARDRHRRLVGEPFTVPLGADHVRASDALWERIDRADPMPRLRAI